MKKLFLSMAFIGIGTFAMAQQSNSNTNMKKAKNPQTMEMRGQKHMDKMKQELNLSDDQVMKIKDLQQKNMAERRAWKDSDQKNDMSKDRKMMKKDGRNGMQDQMKQILTPDQYTKWQNKMQAKREKMKAKKMQMRSGKAQMNSMQSK